MQVYLSDDLEVLNKKESNAKAFMDYYFDIQKTAVIIKLINYLNSIVEKHSDLDINISFERFDVSSNYNFYVSVYNESIQDEEKELLEVDIEEKITNILSDKLIQSTIQDNRISLSKSDNNVIYQVAKLFYKDEANLFIGKLEANDLAKNLNKKINNKDNQPKHKL